MRQHRAAHVISWLGPLGGGLGALLCALASAPGGDLPSPASDAEPPAPSVLAASIERQPICVGSSIWSAGALADTIYYRARSLDSGEIAVGYFVFYSEERPWGNNWMTWTLLPAIGIDSFYSRLLLIAPGIQRAMYGKGDVEGFRILYGVEEGGTLRVDAAVADDGHEETVLLDRAAVLAFDGKRPTLYSDVWSHQLGGRGAQSTADLATLHCYSGDRIRPLPDDIAADFRVANRALPAHVELLDGLEPQTMTMRVPSAKVRGGV